MISMATAFSRCTSTLLDSSDGGEETSAAMRLETPGSVRRGPNKSGNHPPQRCQLRHAPGTRMRREYGLDAARAVLGHSSPEVTAVYAEVDAEKCRQIMEEIG